MNEIDPSERFPSCWLLIDEWARKSSRLFVKKLSRNDTSWADDKGKHQAGFYIPREIRESGFFPKLLNLNVDKPHIFQAACPTTWPQTGEVKHSGMRHYSNKGPETHFTVVPHELFAKLSPASLLLGGRLREPMGEVEHWFMVIDSATPDAELLETALDLGSDFHFDTFDPADLKSSASLSVDEAQVLIEQLHHALKSGTLPAFIRSVATLPSPREIASAAQVSFLDEMGLDSLDPFVIERPGDAIMRISRDIEYRIYKQLELRRRAAEVVGVLSLNQEDLVSAVVRGYPSLDALFLSASQQRKTRAGRSFEQHIARTFRDARIRFVEQAVMGGIRPDFVLPDMPTLASKSRSYAEALILSVKTTLRERWKQVSREQKNCAIFLGTVDDRVSQPVIEEMQLCGLTLVVPESLKEGKETCYRNNSNVIAFREFFDMEIASKRPQLLLPMAELLPVPLVP